MTKKCNVEHQRILNDQVKDRDAEPEATGLLPPTVQASTFSASCILDEGDDGGSRLHLPGPTEGASKYTVRPRKKNCSRYRPALKTLYPFRFAANPNKEARLDRVGLFSFFLFSWLTNLMWKSHKRGLKLDDMWETSPYDKCSENTDRLRRLWRDDLKKHGEKDASFFRACWLFCRTRVIVATLLYWICLLLGLVGPTLFVQKIIEHAGMKDHSIGVVMEGIWLVIGLIACELGRSVIFVGVWAVNYRTCLRIRSACTGILYEKLFEIKNVHQAGSSSDMINLLSTDVVAIFECVRHSLLALGGPVVIVAGTVYSVWLLGPMALVGSLALVSFYPIQVLLSSRLSRLRRKSVKVTDARIHLVTEIINSLRLIKMYAWEVPFGKKIGDLREEEKRLLSSSAWTQSMNVSMTPLVPVVASMVTFISHLAAGGELTSTEAFALLMVYNSARNAYNGMPFALKSFAESRPACIRVKVFNTLIIFYIMGTGGIRQIVLQLLPFASMRISCRRVQEYLLIKPVDPNILYPNNKSLAVVMSRMDFDWEPFSGHFGKSEGSSRFSVVPMPTLCNITLEIPKGTLVGICGQVGSGKSTLFHGMMGQIYSRGEEIAIDGRLGYAAQQAWLFNATVKENICFGLEYNQDQFEKIVQVCSLTRDFASFSNGGDTVIGERGSTLSGGQRQRINLARAVYSDREVMLLDDPLSAVDSRVGADIFNNCIRGYLQARGKTVFLVSGQTSYLEKCDVILVFHAGSIVESGTHEKLMQNVGGQYHGMATAVHHDQNQHNDSPAKEATPAGPAANTTGRLNEKEKVHAVKLSNSYHRYIKAAGGYFVVTLVFLLLGLNMGLNSVTSWWLKNWLKQSSEADLVQMDNNVTAVVQHIRLTKENAWYAIVYVAIVLAVIVLNVCRSFAYMKVTMRAAMKIHQMVLKVLLFAKIKFFETTSPGIILNRISKDVEEIDTHIPFTSEIFLQNTVFCITVIVQIVVVFQWLLIPIAMLSVVMVVITKWFRTGVRDFKRLEAATSSPILGAASSSVQGLSTIHAYDRQPDLIAHFHTLVDANSFPLFCFHCAIRWMGVRLDFLTVCLTACTAVLIVALPSSITSADAGMTLSFAIQLSGLFQYTVRLGLETEGRFTAVDRIVEYIDTIPQEVTQRIVGAVRPTLEGWPSAGKLVFDNVVLRYSLDLPAALKGISFTAEGGMMVGIVGRTGSGKSSIAAALFRLVEISEGRILIDNIDTTAIELHELRGRLSVIPQDPVLFVGSLRYNLDPLQLCSDESIWTALEKVQLKRTVQGLAGKLNYNVVENGGNFSVGERQLICMARALLRQSRILFMDEATASVDSRTDSLLQETIKTAFGNCTILTVAHRLNTVMNYDKIMVVSDGKILEFDSPSALLANNQSTFFQMVNTTAVQPPPS